jgi:hypothetical protein
MLAGEVGVTLAKSVGSRLMQAPKTETKLQKVEALVSTGATAVSAFQQCFGKDFDAAISAASGESQSAWSHERDRGDYVAVQVADESPQARIRALHDELNLNLDRLARLHPKVDDALRGRFLAVFREWMQRYEQQLPATPDSRKTFNAIESWLDGHRRTMLNIVTVVQRAGLGAAGAMFILKAVLLATGTGVGVLAGMSMWFSGIPYGQVVLWAVGGVVLFALSRIQIGTANSLTACVNAAYRLLARERLRHETSSGPQVVKTRELET